MPTQLERLAALETRQNEHEKANVLALSELKEKVTEVEAVAMEAREMVTQTNTLVAQMPDKIIKAVNADKGKKWKNVMFYLIGISAILSPWIIPLVYSAKVGH